MSKPSMAGAAKVDKIRQVVRLKQVMQRWRTMSLRRHRDSDSFDTTRRIPSGFLAVYVGADRRRFVIPTRYLNLPVFVALLDEAAEEFGFHPSGGLTLLCEIGFFEQILKLLETDEKRFGGVELDEFSKLVSEIRRDPCNETATDRRGFTPLLKARV